MDTAEAVKIANTYATAIESRFKFVHLFLFGSYARGNFTEDSDIDIAVVFKDYRNSLDMQVELMRIRRKIDSRIEPHPFREEEFNQSDPLVCEILKFGRKIEP